MSLVRLKRLADRSVFFRVGYCFIERRAQVSVRGMSHIAVLIIFYLIGSWIQTIFNLFIPGSIIGMLLLFVTLLTKKVNVNWVDEGANFFIRHLALLFIPVTVGIIQYLDLFTGKSFFLIPIALCSTLLVMVCSGKVSQYLVRKKEQDYEHINRNHRIH